MPSILEGSLATTIAGALRSLFLDATLTRYVEGTVTDEADPPPPTQVSYPCKAIEDQFSANVLAQGLVRTSDVNILILAKTLAVDPRPGDLITIRGVTRQIVPSGTGGLAGVTSDPARATWSCRAA